MFVQSIWGGLVHYESLTGTSTGPGQPPVQPLTSGGVHKSKPRGQRLTVDIYQICVIIYLYVVFLIFHIAIGTLLCAQ